MGITPDSILTTIPRKFDLESEEYTNENKSNYGVVRSSDNTEEEIINSKIIKETLAKIKNLEINIMEFGENASLYNRLLTNLEKSPNPYSQEMARNYRLAFQNIVDNDREKGLRLIRNEQNTGTPTKKESKKNEIEAALTVAIDSKLRDKVYQKEKYGQLTLSEEGQFLKLQIRNINFLLSINDSQLDKKRGSDEDSTTNDSNLTEGQRTIDNYRYMEISSNLSAIQNKENGFKMLDYKYQEILVKYLEIITIGLKTMNTEINYKEGIERGIKKFAFSVIITKTNELISRLFDIRNMTDNFVTEESYEDEEDIFNTTHLKVVNFN